MAYESDDHELERSTTRIMMVGAGLMLAMALLFPLYRFYEPAARDDARSEQRAALARAGESSWGLNCSSCHGLVGEGGIGPALNSQQFLQSANDQQIEQLVSVGVPGSQMSAYSQDFAGPLTSEQIKALTVYMRSWEDDAPDLSNWREGQP